MASIEAYEQLLANYSLTKCNFTISLFLLMTIPLSFLIFAPDHGELGVLGTTVTFLQMFFSILGIYGVQNKQAWAFIIYLQSLAVLCLVYILLVVREIVVLALEDDQGGKRYPGGIIFLVVLVIFVFFLMAFWNLICYYVGSRWGQRMDWFLVAQKEGILAQGGELKSDLQQDLLKTE